MLWSIFNLFVSPLAATLLGVQANRIAAALTSSNVITMGETIRRPVSIEKAVDFRDAMAKVYKFNTCLRLCHFR